MSETIESGTLVVIPATQLPAIMAADGASDILAALSARVATHKADPTTTKGRDEIRNLAAECRRVKADLDRLGKGLTEGWRRSTEAVNAERKIVAERLDALAMQVRAPLTEFENREKNRVAAHEAAIAEIEGWAAVPADWTAAQIAARIEELKQHPHLTRDWQEFQERGQTAARNAYNALRVAQADAATREAEAARLAAEEEERAKAEALRLAQEQKAREERAAADAAAEATRVAEAKAAEQARLAEEAAQRDREAAAAALAQAEREKAEAEERVRQAETARIRRHPAWGPTESSADIQRRIAWLSNIDTTQFEEFADEAAAAIRAEVERAEGFLDAALKREANAVRVAAHRQAINDLRALGRPLPDGAAPAMARQFLHSLRGMHADRDWQEFADEAYQVREAARTSLEGELALAEQREAAQREEIAAAARRQAAADAEKAQRETAAREANKAHRAKIHREALAPLILLGLSEETGKAVIVAIAKGDVPHVRLEY